ncbi:hypothetical protein ACEWBR_21920 [Vibrio parahaemolyticus]|uniref:hypothetical protein n=1 Tax=Vibrio parahaemolyticus TaxID=670 RepID=UPI000429B607|nr:hypothetical protein [Vibrio parahaemolyticus]
MFGKEIVEFSQNLESLRDFIELVDQHVDDKNKEEMEKNPESFLPILLAMNSMDPEKFELPDNLDDRFKQELDKLDLQVELVESSKDGEEKEYSVKMSDEVGAMFMKSLDVLNRKQTRTSSLYQNSLISVISYVEWFLAQLIHKYYDHNPNAVGIKDKQLSLDDLYELGSIEDARKFLIDSKVESIMRSNIESWVKFFKEQVKLSMGYLSEHMNDMTEACQRRNLYVHNGGTVNSIYIKNCHFLPDAKDQIGRKIDTDREYIEKTISTFERCFILVASELWKKNEPNSESRYKVLKSLAEEHIDQGRYDIAESLSYFLCGDKQNSEFQLLMAKMNYWYAIKAQGNLSKVNKDIEKEDMTARPSIFKFMKANLLSDFELSCEYLDELLHTKQLSHEELMSNVVYKDLVSSDEFIEKFASGSEEN